MIQNVSVYQAISDATNNSSATALQTQIEAAINGNLLNAANQGHKSLSIDMKQYAPNNLPMSDVQYLMGNIQSILMGQGFNVVPTGDLTSVAVTW